MLFRVDDVSINTDTDYLHELVAVVRGRLPKAEFLFAVSPLVHDLSWCVGSDRQRTFPRVLSAVSDHRRFFEVQHAGVPDVYGPGRLPTLASHGLFHVDHRLLGREAQEMSIVGSCSLVASKIFVPPFNKWNKDTESVCAEHGIELVKFEDGWRHVNYNKFDPAHDKWYLHTHDVDSARLGAWLGET